MKPTLPPEWAASAAEWRRERDASAVAKPNGRSRPTLQPVDAARPPAFSDDALALRPLAEQVTLAHLFAHDPVDRSRLRGPRWVARIELEQ